jgi:hypothetical protein
MTNKEAEDHAKKVHALIQKHAALKLLLDLAHEESVSGQQQQHFEMFKLMAVDLLGTHYNKFAAITHTQK